MSSPATTIRPRSIGSSPLMHRRSVDLPEPEAPIRQTTSCSATSRSMPPSTSFVAEGLVDVLDLQRRGHAAPPSASRRRRSRATSQSVSRASGIVSRMKSSAVAKYGV